MIRNRKTYKTLAEAIENKMASDGAPTAVVRTVDPRHGVEYTAIYGHVFVSQFVMDMDYGDHDPQVVYIHPGYNQQLTYQGRGLVADPD